MAYHNASRGILLATLMIGAGVAGAQQLSLPPPPVLSSEKLEELDEAKVRATKLWQMRENIVAAEERFYALFNELNKDDDYDVHCKMEAPLGSNIKRRVCRIAFHEEAQAEEAQAMVRGEYAKPAQMVVMERYPEFQKTALAVINSNLRLRQMVREHEEMEKRYEEERKRRFKGKWILFE